MTGLLYYEVMASGQRVALCVDRHDAEEVARHWYDGQVREAPNTAIIEFVPGILAPVTFPVPSMTTYTLPAPTGEPKRKEDTQP